MVTQLNMKSGKFFYRLEYSPLTTGGRRQTQQITSYNTNAAYDYAEIITVLNYRNVADRIGH